MKFEEDFERGLGTVTINVKSITGYQDKIKKPVTERTKF